MGTVPPKPPRKMLPDFWYRWSRKQKVLSVLALVVVLFGASTAVYFSFIKKNPGDTAVTKSAATTKAKTVASPLTGVQVPPELAARPVTAIMIENSLDARPQSGLAEAGVVFEAIAEGGITRFIALYQEDQPQYIGPVRSLRPYYLDWTVPFDASVAHVGGSPDALAQIRSGGKDLDQFFNPDAYSRIGSRAAPHNVYTSFERLDSLNRSKGYANPPSFKPWPHKVDQPLATAAARAIDMPISSPAFYVHYDYHADDNSYWRSQGGGPHMSIGSADDRAGSPIHPRVVIVLVMPYGIAADGQHSEYNTYGSGSAYIFQDGGVTHGSWTKANRNTQFEFKDANGQEVKLNAGRVWVTAVASGQMGYTP